MTEERSSRTVRLSPVIPTADMNGTRDFLVGALEFRPVMDTPDYMILTRDGYDLHLCQMGDGAGQMSVYLEVENLDRAWEKFSSFPRTKIRVREPFSQPYGMREFHLDIPFSHTLLFVGEATAECPQG